jgi:hypothetical protein
MAARWQQGTAWRRVGNVLTRYAVKIPLLASLPQAHTATNLGRQPQRKPLLRAHHTATHKSQ